MNYIIKTTTACVLLSIGSIGWSMSSPPATELEYGTSDIATEASNTPASPLDNLNVSQTLLPMESSYLSTWQGFDHEWLRFIVANQDGRIPHRISKFKDFISPDSNHQQVIYHFGQDTGVDGNYMHPKARAITIDTNGLFARQGVVNMSWTDNIQDGDVPTANNKVRETITVPFEGTSYDKATLFLQGVELDLVCDDEKQPAGSPCNSDGMWPYVFNIHLSSCQQTSSEVSCELNVDLFRAWTPNQGGFQLIGEVKPLNYHLDYDLNIYFAAIAGSEQQLGTSDVILLMDRGDLYEYDKTPASATLTGDDSSFNTGVAVIKGFGFMLTTPDQIDAKWQTLGSDVRQRGRYLARTRFELNTGSYNASDRSIALSPALEVWAPTTVVNSGVTTEMKAQLLQLGGSGNRIASTSAEGKLCLNSKDEAPFFSAWHKCDRQTDAAIEKFGGVERSEYTAIVELP